MEVGVCCNVGQRAIPTRVAVARAADGFFVWRFDSARRHGIIHIVARSNKGTVDKGAFVIEPHTIGDRVCGHGDVVVTALNRPDLVSVDGGDVDGSIDLSFCCRLTAFVNAVHGIQQIQDTVDFGVGRARPIEANETNT